MSKEGIRACSWLAVLYPESQQEVIEYAQEHFPCAWALHDQDEDENGQPKKPHVHMIFKFKNARWSTGLARELGIAANYLKICKDEVEAFAYLTHNGWPDKHQYPPEAVQTANGYTPPVYNEGKSEEVQVLTLLDMPTMATTKDMARWALENGCWSAFRRSYSMWKDINQEAKLQQLRADQKERWDNLGEGYNRTDSEA